MWKIILAEDEPLLRKALKKILLANPDYEICLEATNGIAVLEYLRSYKADIIISDIRMPAMDGLELIQKIYEQNISIKTIILSGYNDFEYARHMLIYHAFSYLLKPVVPEELIKTVENACLQIIREQTNNSILKSHKFHDFQNQGYAHFTNEMPSCMLHSNHLVTCCIDFEKQPEKEHLVQWQLDFERTLYPCCCFWLDSYLYLVIDLDFPDKDLTESITEVQMYFENNRTSVRIGISLETHNMMEVSQSMKQARKSLRYYHDLPYHKTVYYERISLLEEITASYPLTDEKGLIDAVIGQNQNNIVKYIENIRIFLSHQSTELIYQNMTELFFSCKRELIQYRIPANWDDLYYSIQAKEPWEKLLDQLKDILINYHLNLQVARKSSSTPVVIKAKKYIQEHYTEPLTLDEVANYCFLSKSHFCKIFKTETDVTFKTYLNLVRIEAAKRLLKTTVLKNYEIAESIGFDDPSYFNGLFKKIVGMTPNEYRNSSKL